MPPEKLELYSSLYWKPVHSQIRVPKTKWVVLRWPLPSMAQQADMSTEAFEDFYFDVCNLDYSRMEAAMNLAADPKPGQWSIIIMSLSPL